MVLTCLESILLQIKKEIKTLEGRLLVIVKQEHQEILTGLKTILGIGNITAAMLVVLTDGFSKFETASQLCSYGISSKFVTNFLSYFFIKSSQFYFHF